MVTTPPAPAESPLGVFGNEVRHHREQIARLSQRKLGERIGYSEQAVGMIETGRRKPTLEFARLCDDALETGGLFARLWPMLRHASSVSWFDEYNEVEQRAIAIDGWNPEWIPGLFQTEAYARELFLSWRAHPPAEIDELVDARIERQRVALAAAGPDIWMLVGEGALLRRVGGPEVWRAQLEHLVALVRDCHRWVVQVLPFLAGAHALSDGAINLLSFSDGADMVFTEGPGVGRLIDRAEEVRPFRFRFEHDRAKALPPEESLTFIHNLIREIP